MDGSFDDAPSWREVAHGQSIAGGLLGDVEAGPLVAFVDAAPGAPALASCTFETDVAVMTVRGSCTTGSTTYLPGDLRFQEAGTELPAGRAGDSGWAAVFVVSDRRHARPSGRDGDADVVAWGDALTDLVEELRPVLS